MSAEYAKFELSRKGVSQMATKGNRIPNYEIDRYLPDCQNFTNYNNTIVGQRVGDSLYEVWHWNTKVFTYDYVLKEIKFIDLRHISQTTSTLIGRIIRSLPDEVVIEQLLKLTYDSKERRRIASMARMLPR